MPDYQKMCTTLFNAVSDVVTALQKSQQTTEDMYMSSEEPIITATPPDGGIENGDGDCQ